MEIELKKNNIEYSPDKIIATLEAINKS